MELQADNINKLFKKLETSSVKTWLAILTANKVLDVNLIKRKA